MKIYAELYGNIQKLGIKSLNDNTLVAYCRGPKAVAREISKEGIDFTPEQAKDAINAFFVAYPDIARYINECKEAVLSPGYIQGVYGRYRVAGAVEDEAVVAAMQRQFVNFR